jgi:hypothetical protein
METLVIYDLSGYVISQTYGNVREPIGIPSLKVVVPEGSTVTRVDVSVTPNVAVIEKLEISPTEKALQELNARMTANEEKMVGNMENTIMAIEAAVTVYEAVLPFLPVSNS